MLIRANGGSSGIKEYLEKGQMKDRFFDRDQLDERQILLDGDLNTVDDIINSIDNSGEKYFHFTLAFKEDQVSDEVLAGVTKEFRDFYFKSYNDDEICFYAEAHLPKIKSYRNNKTGALVERKPHVHVIVPKINLLTGKSISFEESTNIDYLNAFQEYINCKYGLESPKDNPRTEFNGRSEIISRYKGDNFTGLGKQHKEDIFKQILENNISSRDELVKLLGSMGYETQIRNKKIESKSYVNITPDGEHKGINLKEFVFSNEFLKLSSSEKENFIYAKDKVAGNSREDRLKFIDWTNEQSKLYLNAGLQRDVPEIHMLKMAKWNELISDQRKYVDRSKTGKKLQEYKDLSNEEKILYLQEAKSKFYEKHGVEHYERWSELEQLTGIYRRAAANHLQSAGADLRVFATHCEGISGDKIGTVTDEWREQKGDEYARIIGVSKGGHVGDVINRQGDKRSSALDSISVDYISESIEFDKIKGEVSHLRANLKADVLLELAEKTHGVIPEKYTITINRGGEDRIKCGTNNYSVVDFCRKELNLNWEESTKLMRGAELMQREVNREIGWSQRDERYLAEEYKSWVKDFKARKDTELSDLQKTVKTKFEQIKVEFAAKNANIKNDLKIPYHKRELQRRELKMERLLENRSLYAARNKDLEEIKSKYNLDMQESYREFLVEKSQAGDDKALHELRRLRIDFEEYQKTGSIKHVDRYNEFRLNITHIVDAAGVITYRHDDKVIIKDTGKRIDLITRDAEHLKLGFDLALSKFGKNIELHGNEAFRRQLVELAIKNNYDVTFKDAFSESYRKELVASMKAEYQAIEKNNKAFYAENYQEVNGLLVTKIAKVDVMNEAGKYSEVTKITVFDMQKQKEYHLSGGQIGYLVDQDKLKEGDLLSIDGKAQNAPKVDVNFWKKYTDDLKSGVLISDYIREDKLIIELPAWKQAKYTEEYFTVSQTDIAAKLKDLGYQHGDLVSVKPSVNIETKTLEYSFEIIGDGSFKKEAKKELIETDIKAAKQEIAHEGIDLTKEVTGKVVKCGHGVFKGQESSFILLEENTRKIDPAILKIKEEFCAKNSVTLADLEKQVAGTVLEIGAAKFNDKAKEVTSFIKFSTIMGEKTLWGNDLARMVDEGNISVGDKLYVAQIGQVDVSKPEDKDPKLRNAFACRGLDDSELEKSAALTSGLYTKYWNTGYKELIDAGKVEVGQTMYIAKTKEDLELQDYKVKDFMVKEVPLDKLQLEKQAAIDTLKVKHDLEIIDKSSSGVILEIGMSKFNENSKESFSIKIQEVDGRVQTLRGVDLERLVKDNDLKPGDGVIIAKVGDKDLGQGRFKAIYDSKSLPLAKEAIDGIKQDMKFSDDEVAPTRQSVGKIVDFGTRTIKGEKLNFIKLETESGKVQSYWDQNLPITGLIKNSTVFVAQVKEQTLTKEIKHERFDARVIAKDLDKRSVELVRKREIEASRKQDLGGRDFSI